jgi:hypothetical protein
MGQGIGALVLSIIGTVVGPSKLRGFKLFRFFGASPGAW